MSKTAITEGANSQVNADDYIEELSCTTSFDEEYLSFSLGEEIYAVDILSVQEIRTWEVPTPLPRSPDYLKGVINLRGTIIPVIDLRTKFKFCEPIYSETTVVIILRIEEQTKIRVMGIIVDAMFDVLFIKKENIQKTPEFGGQVDAKYIEGLTNVSNVVVSLLNTEALLNIDDIDHTDQVY